MSVENFIDTNIFIYQLERLDIRLEAGCTCLYSEDMQGGQQIRGLTIQNPFA